MTLEQRFWSKVDKSGDHWLWTRAKNPAGYGIFVIDGVHELAHRVAWELVNNCKIPPNHRLLKTCEYPACVLHTKCMESGQASSILAEKRPVSRGEAHYSAKLTAEIVKQARVDFSEGKSTITDLARRHGVANESMGAAIHGKTWKHV